MATDCRILPLAAAMLTLTAAAASGQEGGMTGLNLSGDEPIQIESDHLEVRENDGIAIFTGNVAVVQGQSLLRSGKMTVYYSDKGGTVTSGSSDIDRLEVEGKVYFRSETQVATGERGSYDMRTEVLVLSGDEVVLTEGDTVVVGCKLTVERATGLSQLEGCGDDAQGGRVKMLLKPGSQDNR